MNQIIDYLDFIGVKLNDLYSEAQMIRNGFKTPDYNNGTMSRYNVYNSNMLLLDGLKISFSYSIPEQPINLVINKSVLSSLADVIVRV